VQQEEAAEGQVDLFGKTEVLPGLGDGHHLAVGCRRLGHLVPGHRVAVHGIDPPALAHDLGQGHRHVATTGPDIGAGPSGSDSQSFQRGGERPPVDVVSQAPELHAARLPVGTMPARGHHPWLRR
jgi:hypothetical protein